MKKKISSQHPGIWRFDFNMVKPAGPGSCHKLRPGCGLPGCLLWQRKVNQCWVQPMPQLQRRVSSHKPGCVIINYQQKLKVLTSPPARWGLLDFIRAVLLILLLLLRLLLFLLLQFLLDHVCINFHVHFRLANLSPISSPTSARSGHCWTSTAGCRSEWARLDLNQGPSEPSGHRWTSTWDLQSSVGTTGPQPGTFRAQWAPLDLNGEIECQKICQIKCQNVCQIERQTICQIDFQINCQNARRYAR